MDPTTVAAIDIVEVAYSLEEPSGDWLPHVVHAVGEGMDVDVGVYGQLWGGASEDGQPLITQLVTDRGLPDFAGRLARAAEDAGPELIAASSQSLISTVFVMSEWKQQWPAAAAAVKKQFDCKDILVVCATDPDLRGAMIFGHSSKTIKLTPKARHRWEMLGVHIGAGVRLRGKLTNETRGGVLSTDLPLNAEALLNPSNFVVAQAALKARDRTAAEIIRDAAVRIDRARGKLRTTDPDEALETWKGLVRGRWSLVDWFDTDGRRFILAKPNAPHIGDPRELTEREHQVATYAALGESHKMIAYRFGISASTVSSSLRSAMTKLGVRTQPQLVEKLRGLPLSEHLES